MKTLPTLPNELISLKKSPEKIFYKGNIELLNREKISMIGSRRPNNYTKNMTYEIALKLSKHNICIVSGAAMGVDAIAHNGAGYENTIAIMGNGLNTIYPKVNSSLIKNIEKNGLLLSQFEPNFKATPWSFILRNEIVVALGKVIIITQADIDSGSMRSAEIAIKQGKEIYVLPHRIKDSEGTNLLLKKNLAKPIYDIDQFISYITNYKQIQLKKDEFWQFCSNFPKYEDAIKLYHDRVFEAELEGKIIIKNGVVYLC